MSKHTPGPWFWRPSHDPVLVQGADSVGLSIAFACGGGDPRRDEFIANARLIAAAPELLEALKEIVAISDRKHDAWDRAKAAIAKAVGHA